MLPSVDKHVHSSSTAASSSVASPVMSSADCAAGAALWAAEGAQGSIMLPYVRDHADRATARARQEDPRVHYRALKQVHDVCLYKRITQPQEALNAAMTSTATSPLGASLSSSFSSLASSRRGISITMDPTQGHVPGDFEFRGITRVPGSVDTVLDVLASESARENYWAALNTMKEVKAAALLSSARLQPSTYSASSSITSEADGDVTAFPRWSRKYTATKFSKHSAQIMDCCYAEYATRSTETNGEGHSRHRGFVYRRSVSEHALSNASSVSAEPLAKARVQGATRFYIRDWLFDVIETQEPMVCKLILTCTVHVPPPSGRESTPSRSEFREFCTELMVGARRALTHQWKDHAAHAGVRSSSSWRREARCCSVCSAQFSLLRKRHTCRSCGSGVCSKCCLKTSPGPLALSFTPDSSRSAFGSSRVSVAKPQQRGNQKRECLLCAQYGPDSGFNSTRVGGVTTRGRHLSTSMASMSASSSRGFAASARGGVPFELEQEEVDQVHPDLELRSTTSISGSRRQRSQRSIGSVGSQRSISGPDDDDEESDEDVRPYTPRLDLRATTSKLRTASTDSSRSARSAPGIVLLSDLETLTLSGSFHRAASMSARSSATLSASLSSRSPANVSSRLPAKSAAPTPAALRAQQLQQRQDRAASEDNVLLATSVKPRVGTRKGPQESSASTEEDEEVYTEDDLANFTLKLLAAGFVYFQCFTLSLLQEDGGVLDSTGISTRSGRYRPCGCEAYSVFSLSPGPMPSRNPRISNASAQHVRMELDVLAEVETRVQHQRWWSLRFEHPAMEKRFQNYHEESSLVSSKWACGVTLGSATALQAAVFYDVFALQSQERTPWSFVYVAVGGNAILLALWGIFLWTSQRSGKLGSYFQVFLFTLGLSMLMLILVLGLPLPAYETQVTTANSQELKLLVDVDEAQKAHDVSRTLFFLLILLGAVATTWHAQFITFCALGTCTVLALGGWFIGSSAYLRRQWHLVLLFVGSLFILDWALYCGERTLRHKFLRVRHLMLENLKLARQNSVMHQQLSCHVDAVGIGHGLRDDEPRAASPSTGGNVHPHQQTMKVVPKTTQSLREPPAIGESWMENVLRSLSQLRHRFEDDEQASSELDFVLQTLTSEHDLFLDTWSRQRRVPTTNGTNDKADTGWLSLLEEKRNRRRKTDAKQQVQSPMAFLAKTLRRTSSGSRLTVLTMLENFLALHDNIDTNQQKIWTPHELLALSASSQELDLFAFANVCTLPLTTLLLATLESHHAFVTLPLRVESVTDFTQEIEARYQPKNPYHNSLYVSLFSALIAAAIHDVNHPGVNNAFLVATTAPLAIKYSDDSVLERMHLAEAFQTCTKDGCDIFEAFPPDLRRQSRLQIISMVLATDLSGHLTHVNRLKSKLYAVHPASSDVSINGEEMSEPAGTPCFLLPDELVLQTVMMMADVGHAMKSFPLHLAWSERVAEEFFRQGDTERQFGLTISPLCDRSTGIDRFERNQIGFLEFVVLPLYTAARDVLPMKGFDDVIANVQQNAATWERRTREKEAAGDTTPISPPTVLSMAIPATIKEGDTEEETENYTQIFVDVSTDLKAQQVSSSKVEYGV
ncbi:unnamed protein product [Phytophthora lilii]|uniref:Phosphodiesterase n=1 Tax=Phytophthora lilii TaxID=2077276 RepID=A0A9W6TLG6_9STRA|nr:unnamed protein product [Phytophthora lilii]